MSWNYRVVKYRDPEDAECLYGLHEVYYNTEGEVTSMTEEPITTAETPAGIINSLLTMIVDCKLRGPLEEPEAWAAWFPKGGEE